MAIDDSFAPDLGSGQTPMHPVRTQELTDDGAIPIAAGVVSLNKAGVIAATIDTPPLNMNGAELTIISKTAQAHTLTHTPGFGGGTTARDVATFGGAISDNIVLVALDGVWYVKASRNVTLG